MAAAYRLLHCILFLIVGLKYDIAHAQDVKSIVKSQLSSCTMLDDKLLVGEEDKWCTGHYAGMITTCIVANIIPGGCILAVLTYGTALLGSAQIGASLASVCESAQTDGHPYPYTDDQIKRIMRKSGDTNPTVDDIIDKYHKICIQRNETTKWLAPGECASIGGITYCAFNPSENESIVCARVSSTCPCTANIKNGSLDDPEYETDKNGIPRLDKNGNTIIKNEVDFRQNFATHCRIVRTKIAPPFPAEYTGIIDDVCNTWSGYSRNSPVLSAGVVQCIQNTARNIFEKPIIGASTVTKMAHDKVERDMVLRQYEADQSMVQNASKAIGDLIKNVAERTKLTANYHYDRFIMEPLLSGLRNWDASDSGGNQSRIRRLLVGISDRSSLRNKDYSTRINADVWTVRDAIVTASELDALIKEIDQREAFLKARPISGQDSATSLLLGISDRTSLNMKHYNAKVNLLTDINIIELNKRVVELEALSNEIETRMNNAYSTGNEKVVGETIFKTFQGHLKIISIMILIIWISVLGIKILFGKTIFFGTSDPSFKVTNVIMLALQFALVYYFTIGSAWKDYFFNMLFSVSNGVSEMIIQTTQNSAVDDGCNFSMNYHTYDSDGERITLNSECSYPNLKQNNPYAPFEIKDATGNSVLGCINGPFIPRPNYEYPHLPVKFEISEAWCTSKSNPRDRRKATSSCSDGYRKDLIHRFEYLKVYCMDDLRIKWPPIEARIEFDPFSKKERFMCPDGYRIENGYRLDELKKIGFKNIKITFSDPSVQLIQTTDIIKSGDESLSRPKPINIDPRYVMLKKIEYLDAIRSQINKTERSYPVIQTNGVERDMRYIGLFDTLDCKVTSYFSMRLGQVFGNVPNGSAAVHSGLLFGITFATGIFGLIVALMIILIALLMIGIVGKIVQSYLISVIGIVVLVYLSPIFITMSLISQTKGFYDEWLKKLREYIIYPPTLFMVVAIAIRISDYIFYGSSATFQTHHMFNQDGSIDGENCWKDDYTRAPMLCLLSKLKFMTSYVVNLGLIVPSISEGINSDLWTALALQCLKTLVLCYILFELVVKMEDIMSEIFGGSDTKLGTVFDSTSGFANAVKGLAKGVGSAIGTVKNRASHENRKGAD